MIFFIQGQIQPFQGICHSWTHWPALLHPCIYMGVQYIDFVEKTALRLLIASSAFTSRRRMDFVQSAFAGAELSILTTQKIHFVMLSVRYVESLSMSIEKQCNNTVESLSMSIEKQCN